MFYCKYKFAKQKSKMLKEEITFLEVIEYLKKMAHKTTLQISKLSLLYSLIMHVILLVLTYLCNNAEATLYLREYSLFLQWPQTE